MTEEQTFNEWVKQLEPSMAVSMYPKALLLDFMKKAFFAGLEQHSHDYLVKTNDLKANFDYVLEGKDLEIKQLGERCNQLLKDKGDLTDRLSEEVELHLHAEEYIKSLEQQIEKMKSIGRTSYIKGIRTMANALKDYDRTDGAWTDYFEHTVDKVLKKLLSKEIEK